MNIMAWESWWNSTLMTYDYVPIIPSKKFVVQCLHLIDKYFSSSFFQKLIIAVRPKFYPGPNKITAQIPKLN
ncbi:hypothetical protein E1A91_A13G021000v1 [Gossypium mustelinum]|uniref:Uncharacterized protein n=1 Tax=Gossypium mustelinum TaxID=34275 RepID=A0A5D2WDD5_GOSMU|nr:hypothetical protein E1A91_A13G021000v1 [Gossypium mustelinum]